MIPQKLGSESKSLQALRLAEGLSQVFICLHSFLFCWDISPTNPQCLPQAPTLSSALCIGYWADRWFLLYMVWADAAIAHVQVGRLSHLCHCQRTRSFVIWTLMKKERQVGECCWDWSTSWWTKNKRLAFRAMDILGMFVMQLELGVTFFSISGVS